jgi:glycosyltransferase involved in cell wall biosynthesis
MISLIVPAYNSEKYLDACVASLLAQTTKEALQIIVVDDGSDTPVVVNDSSVLLLRLEHAGQSAARNMGLKHAQGEYIAFVDADDSLEPDWCERHMAAMQDVDYVQSGYKRISGLEVCSKTPWNRYQFTSPCMRLYRREAIEGMAFEEGMIYEDVVWSVDLWQRDLRCRRIPYTGYRYTLNPDSTTSRPHPEARKRLFDTLRQRAKNASLRGKTIILYTMLRLKIHYLRS